MQENPQTKSGILKTGEREVRLLFLILSVFTLSCVFSREGYSVNPAPYTKEAYKKLEAASSGKLPKPDDSWSGEQRMRVSVEIMRDIFRRAGYDYEDTIVKVVDDMRHHPEIIPQNPESVFAMIYVGIHIMLSNCRDYQIDCLQFFRPDAAEAIRWLERNTDFNF